MEVVIPIEERELTLLLLPAETLIVPGATVEVTICLLNDGLLDSHGSSVG